jgi:hypothetical protein
MDRIEAIRKKDIMTDSNQTSQPAQAGSDREDDGYGSSQFEK